MPELPEVEVYRGYLAHTVLHKQIKDVKIKEPKVLECPRKKLNELKGKKFTDTARRGKYCFLKMSSSGFLVMHFGMTGDVEYYRGEDPEHSAIIFEFSDGHKFAYTNVRKFGKISVVKSRKQLIEEKELGPDAGRVSEEEFVKIMQSKKGTIKTALMDQQAISGIGNIYSDEIAYQNNILPDKKLEKIDEKKLKSIHKSMKRIFKTVIKNKGNRDKIPQKYLLTRRKAGAECGICSGKIKRKKIGGRSAYYCPKHQK